MVGVLDHALLFSILFLLFFQISQFEQKKLNTQYWRCLCIPIVAYTLILGCRYGWGADYFSYKYRFENPREDVVPGFAKFNELLGYIVQNYVGAYIAYSLMFITSAFALIRTYRYNKYMLALFLPITVMFSTSCIRQAVCHTFVFLALYYINRRQWIGVFLMFPLIYYIHTSALLTIAAGLICFFFWNNPLPVWNVLKAYWIVVVFSFVLTDFLSSQLPSLVQYLPVSGTHFEDYQENSDRWFGAEAIEEERIQTPFAFLMTTVYYSGIIYLCSLSLKYCYNRNVAYIFNVCLIGIFFLRVTMLYEIVKRLFIPLENMLFIPFGYAIYTYFQIKKNIAKEERKYSEWSLLGIAFYMLLYYGRFIFSPPMTGFIWNK